jgi:hypothetical protein
MKYEDIFIYIELHVDWFLTVHLRQTTHSLQFIDMESLISGFTPEAIVTLLKKQDLNDDLVTAFQSQGRTFRAQVLIKMDEELRKRLLEKVGSDLAGQLETEMKHIQKFEEGTYSEAEPNDLDEEHTKILDSTDWASLAEACTRLPKLLENTDWASLAEACTRLPKLLENTDWASLAEAYTRLPKLLENNDWASLAILFNGFEQIRPPNEETSANKNIAERNKDDFKKDRTRTTKTKKK